jgi:hypothetical protein
MSTRFPALHLNENDTQWPPDGGKLHERFASWLRDASERIERQWIENRYWDRAAPAVFGVFMASLITLLVLSYAGAPIVFGSSAF